MLAEASLPTHAGQAANVKTLATQLLAKRPTPGWEFARSGSDARRAVKFHVHAGETVWSFACVYEGELLQAKGFCEKLTLLTEPLRGTPLWQGGGTLACQAGFAPTLLQRMEQVTAMGRVAMVSDTVDELKGIMSENVELLLARGDKLEELDEKASSLAKVAQQFRRSARSARRYQLWSHAKMGVALGTAVTVGVGVLVVPPLVAVL